MTTENLNFNVEKLPLCVFFVMTLMDEYHAPVFFIAKRVRYPPLANYSVSF